jgi:hypothetical protein
MIRCTGEAPPPFTRVDVDLELAKPLPYNWHTHFIWMGKNGSYDAYNITLSNSE